MDIDIDFACSESGSRFSVPRYGNKMDKTAEDVGQFVLWLTQQENRATKEPSMFCGKNGKQEKRTANKRKREHGKTAREFHAWSGRWCLTRRDTR